MLAIRRSLLVAVAIIAVVMTAALPHAEASCGTNPVLGQVCTFAFDFCPAGFLPADGSLLPIGGNEALYSLLGTAYGGNGTSNFALPDLRGRTTVATNDFEDVGNTGGGTTVVNVRAATSSGGVQVPAGGSPFLGLTRCISTAGAFPPRPGGPSPSVNPYLGEIMTFAGTFCTPTFVVTDGGFQSIDQNQALFSLLGTSFGGDGVATFAVPNLLGVTAIGTGQGVAFGQSSGNTNTVNVQTAIAKSVQVPSVQSPFLNVTSCINTLGFYPVSQ